MKILTELVPGYAERLAVRPGVTGLAQINLPPDTDLISVWRKLQLDLEYIEKAGFFLDLRMFLCTSIRLLAMPGKVLMWLFCVHREAPDMPTDVMDLDRQRQNSKPSAPPGQTLRQRRPPRRRQPSRRQRPVHTPHPGQ